MIFDWHDESLKTATPAILTENGFGPKLKACLTSSNQIGERQASGQAQQTPRGITPEDYFSFEFISDPNVSRDGKLVAMSSRKSITAAELELIDGAQIKTRMYHA